VEKKGLVTSNFAWAPRLIVLIMLIGTTALLGRTRAACGQGEETRQLIRAFEQTSSPQAQYAKGKEGNSFYMALEVISSRPDLGQDKCVDNGFITWIRRFFSQEAAQITLTASITGPGETANDAQTIPLFQTSKDETSSPPSCFTEVTPNRIITQFYLVDETHPFKFDAEVKTQRSAKVTGTQTLLTEAKGLLDLAGANAALIKIAAADLVSSAAKTIDMSLAANWSQSRQEKYHFDISAWPDNDDWSHHLDQANFAVANIIATSTGIKVKPTLIPTLTIRPHYQLSMFGRGSGDYYSADKVMVQKLASAKLGDLSTILRNGIKGFTTDQAMSISEPSAMGQFCTQMRGLFSTFLTDDDALAARYAVLKMTTNFMRVAKLQETDNCMEPGERKRLLVLSSSYVVDNPKVIVERSRDSFVKRRISTLAVPLSVGSKGGLLQIIDDVTKFKIDVATDVQGIFPDRTDGKMWGDVVGQPALDQLIEAGGFRLGCAHAVRGETLKNIIAIVMNKKTNKNAGVFVEFVNPDPAPNDDPNQEKPRIKRLSFYPVSQLQDLLDLPDWPEDDCPIK
jgi:hypothetical protein